MSATITISKPHNVKYVDWLKTIADIENLASERLQGLMFSYHVVGYYQINKVPDEVAVELKLRWPNEVAIININD